MTFDLTQFAVNPETKTASQPLEVPAVYVDFLREVATQGVRLAYEGNSAILGHLGLLSEEQAKLPTTGGRFLASVPAELQFTVCRKDGSYKEDIRAQWVDQAPAGFDARPVIMAENALNAFKAFQQSRTEAPAEQPQPKPRRRKPAQ